METTDTIGGRTADPRTPSAENFEACPEAQACIGKKTRKPVAAASPMPRTIDNATSDSDHPKHHSFSISTHNAGIASKSALKHWGHIDEAVEHLAQSLGEIG